MRFPPGYSYTQLLNDQHRGSCRGSAARPVKGSADSKLPKGQPTRKRRTLGL